MSQPRNFLKDWRFGEWFYGLEAEYTTDDMLNFFCLIWEDTDKVIEFIDFRFWAQEAMDTGRMPQYLHSVSQNAQQFMAGIYQGRGLISRREYRWVWDTLPIEERNECIWNRLIAASRNSDSFAEFLLRDSSVIIANRFERYREMLTREYWRGQQKHVQDGLQVSHEWSSFVNGLPSLQNDDHRWVATAARDTLTLHQRNPPNAWWNNLATPPIPITVDDWVNFVVTRLSIENEIPGHLAPMGTYRDRYGINLPAALCQWWFNETTREDRTGRLWTYSFHLLHQNHPQIVAAMSRERDKIRQARQEQAEANFPGVAPPGQAAQHPSQQYHVLEVGAPAQSPTRTHQAQLQAIGQQNVGEQGQFFESADPQTISFQAMVDRQRWHFLEEYNAFFYESPQQYYAACNYVMREHGLSYSYPTRPPPDHVVRQSQAPVGFPENLQAQRPLMSFDSFQESSARRIFSHLTNHTANAAVNNSEPRNPCYINSNATIKRPPGVRRDIRSGHNFGWWGKFVDDGPKRSDETQHECIRRTTRAQDNMRIVLRRRPPLPQRFDGQPDEQYQQALQLYEQQIQNNEAAHNNSMRNDPEYSRNFKFMATKVHNDNQANRNAAYCYLEAGLRQDGLLSATEHTRYFRSMKRPWINLNDKTLYEGYSWTEIKEAEESLDESPDTQHNQAINSQDEEVTDMGKYPCDRCGVIKGGIYKEDCRPTANVRRYHHEGRTRAGPFIVSWWAKDLPAVPNFANSNHWSISVLNTSRSVPSIAANASTQLGEDQLSRQQVLHARIEARLFSTLQSENRSIEEGDRESQAQMNAETQAYNEAQFIIKRNPAAFRPTRSSAKLPQYQFVPSLGSIGDYLTQTQLNMAIRTHLLHELPRNTPRTVAQEMAETVMASSSHQSSNNVSTENDASGNNRGIPNIPDLEGGGYGLDYQPDTPMGDHQPSTLVNICTSIPLAPTWWNYEFPLEIRERVNAGQECNEDLNFWNSEEDIVNCGRQPAWECDNTFAIGEYACLDCNRTQFTTRGQVESRNWNNSKLAICVTCEKQIRDERLARNQLGEGKIPGLRVGLCPCFEQLWRSWLCSKHRVEVHNAIAHEAYHKTHAWIINNGGTAPMCRFCRRQDTEFDQNKSYWMCAACESIVTNEH